LPGNGSGGHYLQQGKVNCPYLDPVDYSTHSTVPFAQQQISRLIIFYKCIAFFLEMYTRRTANYQIAQKINEAMIDFCSKRINFRFFQFWGKMG